MAISEDGVREALKQVIDPELFVNIIDLGLSMASLSSRRARRKTSRSR